MPDNTVGSGVDVSADARVQVIGGLVPEETILIHPVNSAGSKVVCKSSKKHTAGIQALTFPDSFHRFRH